MIGSDPDIREVNAETWLQSNTSRANLTDLLDSDDHEDIASQLRLQALARGILLEGDVVRAARDMISPSAGYNL